MKNWMYGVMAIIAVGVVSCGLIGVRDDISVEQKAKLVRNGAKSGVFFAIREIYKEDKLTQSATAQWIIDEVTDTVMPVLQDPATTLDDVTIQLLLAKVIRAEDREEWQLLIQNAVDLFNMYFVMPSTGDIIGSDGMSILLGFFEGAREGAKLVVELNKPEEAP